MAMIAKVIASSNAVNPEVFRRMLISQKILTARLQYKTCATASEIGGQIPAIPVKKLPYTPVTLMNDKYFFKTSDADEVWK
jgi:hypothetical protein